MRRFLIIVLLFGLSLIFDSTPPPTLALTSINVTTTVDELTTNGQCSLREAIMLVNNGIANDCGSVGSLNFLINVPAGIYTITIGNTWEDTNLDGDFDITTNAEIQLYGDTPATTIIQSSVIAPTEPPTPGQADYRLFHLHNPNGELSLGNLTLRHGYRSDDNGGAILVDGGGISLTNVHITKNIAQSGSAIFNTNLWTNFVQVEIYENQSIGTLGTLVLNNGRMLDSIVRDNISNSAVVLTNYDSYSILNSQIEYNTSLIGNGVIWNQKSLLLDQSTFVTNNGGSAGGVIYNDGSLFVRDSYFEGNTAIEGSVVYTQGELTKIRKSTFVDNGGNSTGQV